MADNRVHLLLYFIQGHHLTAADFLMLREFQKYVNILPIIPKADSFTPKELYKMKINVINEA